MTKTIAQLWCGSLDPVRYFGMDNPEMRNLEYLLERNLENVKKSLNESDRALLEKYYDCVTEYLAVSNEQAFCNGYCLGARLTAEALTSVT